MLLYPTTNISVVHEVDKRRRGLSQPKLVIVGTSKPVLNYVTACITLFNNGEKRIKVRARGRAINVAVEVIQLLRSRFMRDVEINSANIDRDIVVGKDGKPFGVVVLELELIRGKRVNTSKPAL